MRTQDYYFQLVPCDNGWVVKQNEWGDKDWEATQTLCFEHLEEALIVLKGLAEDKISYKRVYE